MAVGVRRLKLGVTGVFMGNIRTALPVGKHLSRPHSTSLARI